MPGQTTRHPELDRWMSEIRLRAIAQIGKISRELEKAKFVPGKGACLPTDGNTASTQEQLKAAYISTSTMHRYEELAAPSEELASVFGAAMENYFGEQAANKTKSRSASRWWAGRLDVRPVGFPLLDQYSGVRKPSKARGELARG